MRTYFAKYGFAAALAFLYLYSFPYFAETRHANELPRAYLTRAMVDDQTFAIDTGVRRWGSTADVSPYEGHQYSNKAPGASMLAAPAYAMLRGVRSVLGRGEPTLAQTIWLCRIVTGVIPALLFLLLLWKFLERWAPDPATRRLAIAAYALGTMAMPYAILYHSHQLSAVCIGAAFVLCVWVIEDGRDERWMWVAGFAAGAAPLVDYQAAFAGVPIAVYVLWKLARRPGGWRPVLYAAAGAAVPIAVLLYYHWACFDSPLRTGYAASVTFANYHQKGLLGMDALRWEAFVGSTISPEHGLVFLSPLLLLALPGWWVLAHRKQWWMLGVTASIVVIYLLFQSSINFWRAGWSMGPRYITVMLPFAMVPITAAIAAAEKNFFLRAGAVALITVGIAVYALSSAVFPHFPDNNFHNPLYEVTFQLLGDDKAPYSLGYALGLRGFASLVPYLLVLAGVVGWAVAPTAARAQSGALGVVLGAAVVLAYGLVPGGPPEERFRKYTCYVGGVMPAQPAIGSNGGTCSPGRGCDAGLACLTCHPGKRLCMDPREAR